MEMLSDPQAWLAFVTLTALEIVLGIDNIIFISILVGRLPKAQQQRGRTIGLALAMLTRILLLLSITWVMSLQADLFSIGDRGISGRDLILIGGGLFLLAKSTLEIHSSLEGEEEHREGKRPRDLHERDRADRDHRHRVLARLRDHGRRHGRSRAR